MNTDVASAGGRCVMDGITSWLAARETPEWTSVAVIPRRVVVGRSGDEAILADGLDDLGK